MKWYYRWPIILGFLLLAWCLGLASRLYEEPAQSLLLGMGLLMAWCSGGFADELRAALPLLKNCVNSVQRSLWEAGRRLLVIDLCSAHSLKIDDITNYYKPIFVDIFYLTTSALMISSIHQNGRRDMTKRNRRTDLQIVEDGDFAKIGKKHFQHVSGAEIKYDCNAWGWRAAGHLWGTLEVAVYMVRKQAEAA